jgi:hypothetical protein
MTKKTTLLLFLITFLSAAQPPGADALDFWQYPEMAESNALFVSCFAAQFNFSDYFTIRYPEIIVDYLLPVRIPVFIGAALRLFDPELARYGLRLGYHINFDDENLDVYVFYDSSIIFSDEYTLLKLIGSVGFRRRFGSSFCITVETGFLLQNIFFGVAIKLN